MSIKKLDRVAITRDLPEEGVAAGYVGVVVLAPTGTDGAFEVEVFALTGDTLAVATVPAGALRPVSVVSARAIAAE